MKKEYSKEDIEKVKATVNEISDKIKETYSDELETLETFEKDTLGKIAFLEFIKKFSKEFETLEDLDDLTMKQFSELLTKFKNLNTQVEYLEMLSKPAEKYIFPNDKIINKLDVISINGAENLLSEEKKGSKEVTTYISFDFDEAAKDTDLSEFTLTFSEFDKQVQEAVVSLMKSGNRIITPFMIYKTLTGNSSKQISEKWESDIKKSMKKFNSVNITANLTETTKLYPALNKVESLVKQTRLMQFETTYVKSKNGNEVFAYKMFTEPILYTIADAKKQVGTLDIKLLENSKTSNTVDNTELKIYLLKRINSMKHGQNSSILFETLYSVAQRETIKEKRTTRANIEKLLMQFKADKVIKDFEIEMKGRQPYKIKIKL